MLDVRGANLYIEDGNEMYNRFLYNVAICPHALKGAKHGCTIPGTDDAQADTALNQAGLWGLGSINHMIGNRMANSFNGMMYEVGAFGGVGRGAAAGKCCTKAQLLGHMTGNTFHGHGRFGTYMLGNYLPKKTDQSLNKNGYVTDRQTCQGFKADGSENAVSVAFSSNVDYHNVFVGAYDMGDVQYLRHTSIENNNLAYWKTTKNMADGCAPHIKDGFYRGRGTMALPDQASFVIENTHFEGQIELEANHHCNIDVTGVLCLPVYVFANVSGGHWMYFQ